MDRLKSFAYMAITLALITIASRATNNMIVTTLPPFGKYVFGFSNLFSGFLDTLIYISTFISTSYLNPLLNPIKRRKAFIISNIAIVIVLIIYFFANQYILWLVTPVAGIASGLILPNLITSASLVNERRLAEKLLGLYSTSLSISLIIGPSLESYVLKIGGSEAYRAVFIAFLPIALLGAVLSFTIRFPDISTEKRGKNALRNKGFISSILSITTYNVPFAALTAFLTIYAKTKFDLPNDVAYFSYIPFFALSFLTRSYMTIRPFKTLRLPLLVSILITICGLLGIILSPSYLTFILLMAILGIPHGSIFPMSTIMIARSTTQDERNAANSYFLAYNNILFMGVPAIVGYLSSLIGLGNAMLLLEIPVVIASIAFFVKFWSDNSLL
ncbi:MFS transporter [Candidatus Acidianus copahuensis]|uniref:MFS transporter n=1 Tax=Candidatus Acidianus copahuensis TaxID=1160895 RepID=A0A031LMV7_9CREN|nr:MFS transporter [Candidatus Acidianus copahuensis]EZQ03225.1 MFS transporter [Candidatus Acidianus copahuensis]